jgi:hypothetical protein
VKLNVIKYRKLEERISKITGDFFLIERCPHTTDKKTNSVAFSPQANYTDRATAACRRSFCELLRIEGVAWSAQRIPTDVNYGFLDRSRYFSIQVARQLSSRGCVDPVPDPVLLRKSGNSGNETRDLWVCSQELLTTIPQRWSYVYKHEVKINM